jgi:hypothetical protein
MERGYFLPSLRLEADELDAIVLGLRLVTERATPVLDGAAQRAAAKISSALGGAQKERHGTRPLPEISFTDETGGSLPLKHYRGQVVLLNIWATWRAVTASIIKRESTIKSV